MPKVSYKLFHPQTVLFCEGSRFSDYDYEKCKVYAKNHGIEVPKHLLLPRTKGFTMAIDSLKGSGKCMYLFVNLFNSFLSSVECKD